MKNFGSYILQTAILLVAFVFSFNMVLQLSQNRYLAVFAAALLAPAALYVGARWGMDGRIKENFTPALVVVITILMVLITVLR